MPRIGRGVAAGYPSASESPVGRSAAGCRCLSYTGPLASPCCMAYRMSWALELIPIFSRIRVR